MPVYDSYNSFYKSPFGAIAIGKTVHLRLALSAAAAPWSPRLMLRYDPLLQPDAAPLSLPLQYEQTLSDSEIFGVDFTPAQAGLYEYWFDLYRDYCKVWLADWGNCELSVQPGKPYTLFAYEDTPLPEQLTGGVMYQIFPDRFYEGDPDKPNPFADRIYRTDKQNAPYYHPNEEPDGYLNRDYFGGDLAGIRQKLPYLARLGVSCIYCNPIFESHANHRYNTADYFKIDPMLGTQEDFTALCSQAHAHGIRIILDGVFSHTGADSVYFNQNRRYPTVGAFQSTESSYRNWFDFDPKYPCGYRSWWGFASLPEVNENDPSYQAFICGENGVLRHWLRAGADGWRLDVVDELPDEFIAAIRTAVKAEGDDKLLLGEVWEDAATKVSYGDRRRFLWGQELDSVMNYPWRTAVLNFIRQGNGLSCARSLMALCDRYPPFALHTLMNSLSTHDTERAVTALAGPSAEGHDRRWQAHTLLTEQQYLYGKKLLRLAMQLQFFLPGNPCVYYGDEIAMQGYRDPFNRAYYDWSADDGGLRDLIAGMAAFRRSTPALHIGQLQILAAEENILGLLRTACPPEDPNHGSRAVLLVNRGETDYTLSLPWGGEITAAAMSCTYAKTDR